MFEGVNWIAVVVGAVASFAAGWFYYGPRIFYKSWSRSAGISHAPGDPMGAAFGSLTVGLILYAIFVGIMMAKGLLSVLIFGIVTFIIMAYSNNAFKKLGAISRTIDAGSWALSGVLMILAQLIL